MRFLADDCAAIWFALPNLVITTSPASAQRAQPSFDLTDHQSRTDHYAGSQADRARLGVFLISLLGASPLIFLVTKVSR